MHGLWLCPCSILFVATGSCDVNRSHSNRQPCLSSLGQSHRHHQEHYSPRWPQPHPLETETTLTYALNCTWLPLPQNQEPRQTRHFLTSALQPCTHLSPLLFLLQLRSLSRQLWQHHKVAETTVSHGNTFASQEMLKWVTPRKQYPQLLSTLW